MWKFSTALKIDKCNENLFLWWKFIIMMEIHHNYGNSSFGRTLNIAIKIHHCDKNSVMIKIIIRIGNKLCDKNSSI